MLSQMRNPGRFFISVIGLMVAANLSISATTAAADNPLNLVTSPLPIDLSTPPGHTVSADIRVQQRGSGTEQLKVTLMKFGAYGDSGKPQILDRGPGDTYFDWV